jgi:hypothetical protein
MVQTKANANLNFEAERESYLQLRHLWKDDPERYCRQRLGLNPTWQQQKVLDAIKRPGAKVSVRSGHGIGKDAIAAGIIWWFMEVHDFPRCACTAPSAHQLRDILWGELAKWKRRADRISASSGHMSRFWLDSLFQVNQNSIQDLESPLEWYAIARTARKENPEALQGLHASDLDIDESGKSATSRSDTSLLFIIDEASGVPDIIFEVAEGALSSTDSRVLMLGNPTRNTGYFAASHKHRRQDFTALHFKSSDSPLVDADFRDGLVRRFGEDSNVVRVRSDGEFPKQDDDTLISIEWAEAALNREYNPKERVPTGLKRLGIDPARYGSDRTAFVLRHDFIVSFIDIKSQQDTMITVGQAVHIAEHYQIDDIAIDSIGLGAGIYDRLAEIMRERKTSKKWHCTVTEVDVAESAPEKTDRDDGQCYKLRDYLWVQARQWLREKEPCFIYKDREYCETLAGELTTPKYWYDSSGRIVVESKDDRKSRLSKSGVLDFAPSPDVADSLCLTFAPIKAPPPLIMPMGGSQHSKWMM